MPQLQNTGNPSLQSWRVSSRVNVRTIGGCAPLRVQLIQSTTNR